MNISDKKNYSEGQSLPLGLSMAMAQNPLAFDYFAKLNSADKQNVINASKNVRSRREMSELTDMLAHGEMPRNTSFR